MRRVAGWKIGVTVPDWRRREHLALPVSSGCRKRSGASQIWGAELDFNKRLLLKVDFQ